MDTIPPQYLVVESATNPKTHLVEEFLRWCRAKENGNGEPKKIIVNNHHVDHSYLRWANIGLGLDRYPDKKWTSPIQVVLNRERKLIHIVDPTNAHFYEDPEKFPNRIWMDVVEEYKAKMKYLFVCDCPSRKECTCCDGWEVDFFRCKEINPVEVDGMEYPERTMTFLMERKVGNTIMIYYMRNFCEEMNKDEDLDFFMKQIEKGGKDKPEFWDQEEIDDINEFMKTKVLNISEENENEDENGQGAPGSGNSSAGDENEASSSDKKESGGADTKVMCNLCGKTKLKSEIRRCARCKKVYYCDKDCQKEDWKSHKGRCVPPPINFTLPNGETACLMPPMKFDGKDLTFMPARAQPKLQKKKKKEQ